MNLSSADLHTVTQQAPATGEQRAYFAWLAWTLVIVTIVLALAWVATRIRALAAVTAVLAVTGLVSTLFAVKGQLTWSQLGDQLQYIRVGGYLLIVGYLISFVAGLLGLRKVPASPDLS